MLLLLRTSRVDIAAPYCFVCADQNAPAFTTGPPFGSLLPANESGRAWSLTPRGAVLSAAMTAVEGARLDAARNGGSVTMQQLDFWQAGEGAAEEDALSETSCGQVGLGAGGYCVHDEHTSSPCACEELCARFKGCKAWQWIKDAAAKDFQICYLKPVVQLSPQPDSVSGACWRTNGTACLPRRPPPLNETLVGWAFARRPSAGKQPGSEDTGGVTGAILLHLGANTTALDLSGLFDQAVAPPWTAVLQYQRGGAMALLSNMSTVVREVTVIRTADEARRVAVPAYAVVTLGLG